MLRLAPVQCGLDVLDGRWTDEPMAAVLFCEWMMVVARAGEVRAGKRCVLGVGE